MKILERNCISSARKTWLFIAAAYWFNIFYVHSFIRQLFFTTFCLCYHNMPTSKELEKFLKQTSCELAMNEWKKANKRVKQKHMKLQYETCFSVLGMLTAEISSIHHNILYFKSTTRTWAVNISCFVVLHWINKLQQETSKAKLTMWMTSLHHLNRKILSKAQKKRWEDFLFLLVLSLVKGRIC
jgi:hypothetical protein